MPTAAEPNNWVQAWLSPGRWQRYLDHCGDDADQALELYEWNVSLSGAVMHDVAHIEVAIRNVYDQTGLKAKSGVFILMGVSRV